MHFVAHYWDFQTTMQTHANFGLDNIPLCRVCEYDETVEHILCNCLVLETW